MSDFQKMARTLAEASTALQPALGGAWVGFWYYDLATRELYASPGFWELIGLDPGAGAAEVCQHVDPEHAGALSAAVAELVRGDTQQLQFEMRMRHGAGRDCWVVTRGRVAERSPDGQPLRLIGSFSDITHRKQAELNAEKSRQLLRSVLDVIPHPLFWKDRDGVYLGCNRAYARLLGLPSPEAVVGMTPADMPWSEEFRRVVATLDKEVVEHGREFINVPREDPDFGKPTPTLSTVVPLRHADGSIAGVISVLVDVAELRKAQEGLQQAEQRLVLALESAGAGVWDVDVASNHVYRSPSALAMLGYAEDGMSSLMEDMPSYIHPDDQPREAAMRARVAAGESDLIEMEHRVRCGDGSYRWVLTRGAVLQRDESGLPTRLVGTFTNIHDAYLDRTRAAEQRKLESIGRLAAGVAHEINTPLQFVGDSVEYLRGEFASLLGATAHCGKAATAAMRADVPKAFEMLQDGITRIAEIVRAMRDFSHPGSIAKEPVDVGDLLRTALALSRHEYKNVADVHTDFAVLPPLTCHPGELSQVFVNLVVNAAQAIAELDPSDSNRGLITLRTRLVERTVLVEVEDTGGGIPQNIIDRVFDPFFTTKPMGHGTGQGLAIARNIVEQHHGGRILVESHEGHGTVMQILLPLEEGLERAVA